MKHFSLVNFLEDEVYEKVRNLQEELFEIIGSQECLKHWKPHLTIGDGVSIAEYDLTNFENKLTEFSKVQKTFPVTLAGFGTKTDRVGGVDEVTTPYVLWINVQVDDNLRNLVRDIKEEITDGLSRWYQMPEPYTPHVTVAFRDLSKEGFDKGREYLEQIDINLTAPVSHIAIVERQTDSDIEHKRFYFGQ